MNGITGSTALWYTSRATGVVSLLLLTAVVVLGMLVNRQGRLPGLPRFVVTGLHRNLSLLSVAFVAVHVVTAIADPYVSIRLAAAVIPFASAYKPFWLGLGAVSLDLMAALIVTSLARARISRRLWRGMHWLAYAAWPVAVAHSFGSSTDLQRRPAALRGDRLRPGCWRRGDLAAVARSPRGAAGGARRGHARGCRATAERPGPRRGRARRRPSD